MTSPTQSADEARARDWTIERDANGEAMLCTGCGTTRTVDHIRYLHPTALTCCPERKMVPVREAWEAMCNLSRPTLAEGMAMVPIEPTEAMREAFYRTNQRIDLPVWYARANRIWSAMLSAAPALSATPAPSETSGEEQAQRLQDHMEQFHGIVLPASAWDAAIAALSPPASPSDRDSALEDAAKVADQQRDCESRDRDRAKREWTRMEHLNGARVATRIGTLIRALKSRSTPND